jgi:hypothetical protein
MSGPAMRGIAGLSTGEAGQVRLAEEASLCYLKRGQWRVSEYPRKRQRRGAGLYGRLNGDEVYISVLSGLFETAIHSRDRK